MNKRIEVKPIKVSIRTQDDACRIALKISEDIRKACEDVIFFSALKGTTRDGKTETLLIPHQIIENFLIAIFMWDDYTTKDVHEQIVRARQLAPLWTEFRNKDTDLFPLLEIAHKLMRQPYYYPFNFDDHWHQEDKVS